MHGHTSEHCAGIQRASVYFSIEKKAEFRSCRLSGHLLHRILGFYQKCVFLILF